MLLLDTIFKIASPHRLLTRVLYVMCILVPLATISCTGANAESFSSLDQVRLPQLTDAMLTYSRIRYALFFFSIFYSLVVLFLILHFKIAAWLRNLVIRATRNKALQIVLYSVLLTIVISIFSLPLSFGSGYFLEHRYGLSDQPLIDFAFDKLKTIAVSAVINAILFLTFFGIVRKFRHHWPLVLWLICIPAFAFAIFAEPLIIDPLFNKFTPMAEGALKQKITALAERAKIPDAVILVADKSKQTKKMNAYVTGIGNSSRIVLWDSTIDGLPEDQVLSVVGHEIGHYNLRHIYWGYGVLVLCALLFVPIAYFGAKPLLAALPDRYDIGSVEDYAFAPVLMFLVVAIGFFAMPLINCFSRWEEHEADRYGLELTNDRLAMANLFISFAQKNLSEPDPPAVIKFFLFTHPTLKERIEFAAGRKVN